MTDFATPEPITAELEIPSGRVHLVATDRTDTTVDVRPTDETRRRDAQAAERATVTHNDGVVRVAIPQRNEYLGPSGSVEVTVALPTGSRAQVTAAGAELRTQGRFGEVTFDGAQGPIMIDEADVVRLSTQAGDVTVGRLGGNAEISTMAGDIIVTEAARGAVTLRTQAGRISVGAAAGISASLDAGTSHGRITNDLRNDGIPALTIRATTASGDIVARSL